MKLLIIQLSDMHCRSDANRYSQKIEKAVTAIGTLGKYDKVIGQLNSLDDFKDKSGDVYVMKKVANILNNEKTLFNFIVDEHGNKTKVERKHNVEADNN